MVLTTVDYLVIAAYLVAITAFGSWFGRFQKTTRDYFLTGRSVPWWAICFTIVATETSTLTFIGVPAQAYAAPGNMTFLQLAAGYIIGRFIVSALFIPAYFRGELFTSYELLQRSEEHTSELQSQSNLVCRLLLEKKKQHNDNTL